MKKSAQIFLLMLSVIMLAGCGKDTTSELKTDEANTKAEESAETEIQNSENQDIPKQNLKVQDSETQNQEASDAENDALTVSVEELSDKYTDCIVNIEKDCDTLEELAFATVDVNNDGQIITTGPFGCYGGIKYAPKEGKIISVMDNMDYMTYELINIDENYETDVEQKYEIEPGSDEGSFVFFLDDEEVTDLEYSNAFAKLKNMDVRCLDYDDMFMYSWTTADPDIIAQHLAKLLEEDEPSRECHMIIPMVEKAKLIGTWEMYSSEIEGEISYAKDGGVNGKITVHEDYTVDLDFGRHKMSGMYMDFYNGSFNDYADNTDWYVVIDASEEDGTTIYMNVSEENQLTVNTIGEGETLISLWDIYNRAK